MRKINCFVVLMSVVGMASGLLFAEEDSGTDAEDAVRVLRLLGGKGAAGLSSTTITLYRLNFKRIDEDGDERATRQEYVVQGQYMNEQARAGIFRAMDRDGDQVVTAREYVENRIITDEAKAIFEGLKGDDGDTVDRGELAQALQQVDGVDIDAIFGQFDTNGDGQWQMIEYLRVWGELARQDSDWVDPSKANSEGPAAASHEAMDGPPLGFGPGRGGPRGGFGFGMMDMTAAQFPGPDEVFKRLDRDGDGVLTMEERREGFARGGRPGGFGPPGGRPGGFGGSGGRPGMLSRSGLKVGDVVADVPIHDAKGEKMQLRTVFQQDYTVLVFGCLTCPVFLRSYPGVEAVARDYADRGVQFYYVYKTLAHPENHGYVDPLTLDERLKHIEEAQSVLGTEVTWLCDTMKNEVKHALGDAPNSAFVLDKAGAIVHMQSWFDEEELRSTLDDLVGVPEQRTSHEALHLPEVQRVGNGERVLPRLQVPSILVAVQVTPQPPLEDHYAKLRVEVTPEVLSSGTGKLYLGFHLDPILDVHWNNLTEPLRVTLAAPEGVTVSPATQVAPKVDVETDTTPREFLVDLRNAKAGSTLTVDVHYFACSDSAGWCREMKQRYIVGLERDDDMGRVIGRRFTPGGGRWEMGRRPGGGFGGFGGSPSR